MNAIAETLRTTGSETWDVERVRADFPILEERVHGFPVAYMDSAASAQKPRSVIEAVDHLYRHDYSNVHRGVHTLSERATAAYEGARDLLQRFINARSRREIVFVRGATEAINLVVQSFGRRFQPGDQVIISMMEHHANIVPWQLLREQTGIELKVAPINQAGELDLEAYEALLGERTRLVALTHVSNALGTINPVRRIIDLAHARQIPVLLDGAQAVPHMRVDVQALDCEFFAFSGHKMFGPTGIGVLYAKEALLDAMPPYQGGGDMIRTVSFERTTYNDLPYKFEAGTPNIAGVVGLGAAAKYLDEIDIDRAGRYEHELLIYASERLQEIPGLRLIGTARNKAAVLSFVIERVHPHDLGTILDKKGIAVRAGHHCAMPLMNFYGVPATARASLAFYNTREEIDRLCAALAYAQEMLA